MRAETGKDGAMTDRDLEGLEPMLLTAELGGHTALMFETTVERHPAQTPL